MKNIIKVLKDDNGSEIVALVICTPLLMFILSLTVTFSQIIYASQVALNAAAAGSRVAITQANASTAKTKASSVANGYINSAGMGVTLVSDQLSYSSWDREAICTYKVTVNIKTALPMPNFAYGSTSTSYQITKGCPMMIEKE